MISGKRKRIWKRLRFWGGVLLVVVVGIGGLLHWSYRKALGPPPTPPGKCREFDEHLADIDKDWLFVFEEGSRLVLVDIHGDPAGELFDPAIVFGTGENAWCHSWRVSPDGKWAVVACLNGERPASSGRPRKLALVQLGEVDERRTEILHNEEKIGFYEVYWLDNTTFLVTTHDFSKGVPPRGRVRFADIPLGCLRYEIDDPSNPVPVTLPTSRLNTGLVYDDEARAVFFLPTVEGFRSETPRAYEVNGFRNATEREVVMFKEMGGRPSYREEPEPGRPSIRFSSEIRSNGFRARLMRRLSIDRSGRPCIRLDGKVVRILHGKRRQSLQVVEPLWKEKPGLCIWHECEADRDRCYYMDSKGRYRFWYQGIFWGMMAREQE